MLYFYKYDIEFKTPDRQETDKTLSEEKLVSQNKK